MEIDGIPVRSEQVEFAEDELIKCSDCGRSTPPNRLDCLYCGAEISGNDTDKKLKPVLRPPEEGNEGFSIVATDASGWNSDLIHLAAGMTRLAEKDIRALTSTGSPIPIGYGGSEKAVALAADRLREAGLKVKIIRDSEFVDTSAHSRLRGLSFDEGKKLVLIHFNNDEVTVLGPDDISLIVVGLVLENRFEASEKHKRKGLDKVLNSTEVSADEVYIDFYTRDSSQAFRIQASGFDFSFLGERKELLAVGNLEKTIDAIRKFATNAVFDNNYRGIHSKLDLIWKIEHREDTKSIKRSGFGSFEKKRVVTSSNLDQFNKYSKLQWMIRCGEDK